MGGRDLSRSPHLSAYYGCSPRFAAPSAMPRRKAALDNNEAHSLPRTHRIQSYGLPRCSLGTNPLGMMMADASGPQSLHIHSTGPKSKIAWTLVSKRLRLHDPFRTRSRHP